MTYMLSDPRLYTQIFGQNPQTPSQPAPTGFEKATGPIQRWYGMSGGSPPVASQPPRLVTDVDQAPMSPTLNPNAVNAAQSGALDGLTGPKAGFMGGGLGGFAPFSGFMGGGISGGWGRQQQMSPWGGGYGGWGGQQMSPGGGGYSGGWGQPSWGGGYGGFGGGWGQQQGWGQPQQQGWGQTQQQGWRPFSGSGGFGGMYR